MTKTIFIDNPFSNGDVFNECFGAKKQEIKHGKGEYEVGDNEFHNLAKVCQQYQFSYKEIVAEASKKVVKKQTAKKEQVPDVKDKNAGAQEKQVSNSKDKDVAEK